MRLAQVSDRPGVRLITHLGAAVLVWFALTIVTGNVDPLMNYYIALAAMYATAMFGMVVLVGLSGQVSLGNGALMAVGAYAFALASLNWQTVPLLGVPMNGWWAMVFAAIGGVVFGLVVGGLAARLKGPYLAGLTLGLAVGLPAIASRFPDLFGGEDGLILTVPYPEGGYAPVSEVVDDTLLDQLPDAQVDASAFPSAFPSASAVPSDDLLTLDNFPSASAVPGASAVPTDGASPDGLGLDADSSADSAGFVIEHWQASLAVLVMCIGLFVVLNLVRGRQGHRWRAVRDDPVAAAVCGIWPAGAKVSAFVFSSLFAALAGGVFAQILTYVGPGAFGLGLSLSLLVGVVLGGRSSILGAVIGAVLLVWLPEFVAGVSDDRAWPEQVTNNMSNLLYGLLVVLVVLVAPGGIVGSLRSLSDRARRRRT
jgi:ABC-type branched-subunit amino acid transport system permease subunit